jgi:competence protein ComEC
MLFSAIASVVGVVDGAVHIPVIGTVATWLAGGSTWLALWVIVSLGTAVASVPYAALPVQVPPPLAIAWFPVLGLATWATRNGEAEPDAERLPAAPGRLAAALRRIARPMPMLGALVVVLLAVTVAGRPDGMLHVTVLDVGQGDAILVEAPSGATMLVDGGPDPELTLRRLGANQPFLARRIDLLVLSHPHQDHVAGLVEVLARYKVGAILHAGITFENPAFDRFLADASAGDVLVTLARAGQTLALDARTTVRVLYPTGADASAPLPDGDINNGSVVLEVSIGGFEALLTGDAEAPVEAVLAARGLLGPVELLKVGHHGSHSSTTPALLGAARPTVAAISAGIDNEYGHPAPETLATLAGVAVFRTDLDGDIEVATDGHTYRVRTDAGGWSAPRAVHDRSPAGSIGPWPSRTDQPPFACSMRPACPPGSWSTRAVSPAWRWPQPGWWPRPRSRSTVRWSRRRRCCTTSTRPRSAAPAGSTASSVPGASRQPATRSSPCRSPPIRSARSSTRLAIPSAGHPSWWRWPIATWPRSS